MSPEAAEIIANHSNDAHYDDDYSGRGMYGETTSSVVFNRESNFYEAMAHIMLNGDEDERTAVAKALFSLKMDNMGLGIVIY